MVDRQTIQILHPEHNVSALIPITFNNKYYSTVNIMIHSVLYDYKFRAVPLYYSVEEEHIKIVSNSERVVVLPLDLASSLEEVLFPKGITIFKVSMAYIGKIYDDLIQPLINAHKVLVERIKELKKNFGAVKIGSYDNSLSNNHKEESKKEFKIHERQEWIEFAKTSISIQALTKYITTYIDKFSILLCHTWNEYIELLSSASHEYNHKLLKDFIKLITQSISMFVYHSEAKAKEFPYLSSHNAATEHKNLVRLISKKQVKGIDNIPLKDLRLFGKVEDIPLLFEGVIVREKEVVEMNDSEGEGNLFVFVHGFQGSSFDTRIMRNVMILRFPKIETLCSVDNEGNTEGNIEDMGRKLGREVREYIEQWSFKTPLKKISFFGHSLGGVITRAALPLLAKYKDKMHAFITFSSPHLGCIYQDSKLVKAGMWFLKKWNTSKALDQLGLSDNKDYRETFMYKLSKAEGLGWFKHIFLISSFLDSYSPYDSARIEIYKKVKSGSAKETAYMEMASNILSQIKASALYRIDVAFRIKSAGINTFIGRTAHIEFLENKVLMQLIAYRYAHLFVN